MKDKLLSEVTIGEFIEELHRHKQNTSLKTNDLAQVLKLKLDISDVGWSSDVVFDYVKNELGFNVTARAAGIALKLAGFTAKQKRFKDKVNYMYLVKFKDGYKPTSTQ